VFVSDAARVFAKQTADWWSVGVLLFEMLTGSAPFRAKNRAVLQKKILTEKIKYPAFLTNAAHKLLLGLLQRDEVRRGCRTRRVGASCIDPTHACAFSCRRSDWAASRLALWQCSSTSSSSQSTGASLSAGRCVGLATLTGSALCWLVACA
jgi:serine/threonine protein kinase